MSLFTIVQKLPYVSHVYTVRYPSFKLLCSLSTLLASVTSNATYLDSALLSFRFLHDVLYDSSTGLVHDEIDITTCGLSGSFLPQDSGPFIEGTSLLFKVTGNSSYQAL